MSIVRRTPIRLPTELAMVLACVPVRLRVVVIILCTLLLTMTVLGPRTMGDGAYPATLLLPFPLTCTALIWFLWMGRLAILQGQTADLCLPGFAGALARTLLAAATLTVVVPGICFLLLGVDPVWALGLPVLVALWGLLAALSPGPFAWLLLSAPLFGPTVWQEVAMRLGMADRLDIYWPETMLACTAVAALLLAWRWSAVVRASPPEVVPRWRRAMVFNHAPNAVDLGASSDSPRAHTPQTSFGWSAPVTRADVAGPHDPAGAIGACMGGTLGERKTAAAVKEWSVWAAVFVILLANPLSGTRLAFMRDAFLWGAVGGTLAFGWILAWWLQAQQRRVSGALAELALLPGLGASGTAGQALLGLIKRRLARLLLFILIGLCLAAWTRQIPVHHVMLMSVMWLGVAAGSDMLCMRALAGDPIDSIAAFLSVVPLIALVTITMTLAFLRIPEERFLLTLLAAWSIAVPGYLAGARVMLRRVRARPHPFLLT